MRVVTAPRPLFTGLHYNFFSLPPQLGFEQKHNGRIRDVNNRYTFEYILSQDQYYLDGVV